MKQTVWINPTGGLGDILMLSGVLKAAYDRSPTTRFNLVRRSSYTRVLKDHPAIDLIGYPPKDATIVSSDYWSIEPLGGGLQRPYQILARNFGLETPAEENLFLPGNPSEDDILLSDFLQDPFILIAPASESPRKSFNALIWTEVVERLSEFHLPIIQVGREKEIHIAGTYSFLGLTTPLQLVPILKKSAVLLTVDNFLMHLSHYTKTSAVALWGPTSSEWYGYPEQTHLNGDLSGCHLKDQCLGPSYPEHYAESCPLGDKHCMNSIEIEAIVESVGNYLKSS